MGGKAKDAVVTSLVTDGAGSATSDFGGESIIGHPVGVVVTPQTDSDLPLCAINVTTNLEWFNRPYPVFSGGTGANLSGYGPGLLWQSSYGGNFTSLTLDGVPSGYAPISDGAGGIAFGAVTTPSSFAAIDSGHVMYGTGTSSIGHESNFFYDAANNRLGIGGSVPYDTFGPPVPSKTVSVWGDVGIYDPDDTTLGDEVIQEGDFAASDHWVTTGGCSIVGNAAAFSYNGSSTYLQQTDSNFLSEVTNDTWYAVTYTISGVSGSPSAIVYFAGTAVGDRASLTLTAGTHTTPLNSGLAGVPYSETFWIVATLSPGDTFTIDNISVKPVSAPSAEILLEGTGAITAGSITLQDSGPGVLVQASAGSAVTADAQLILERGGTEADLSATGPGLIWQSAAGTALAVFPGVTVTDSEGDEVTITSTRPSWLLYGVAGVEGSPTDGAGGQIYWTGGKGADSVGAGVDGGAGGGLSFRAGAGGTSASGTPGAGGNIKFKSGDAGSGGTANGTIQFETVEFNVYGGCKIGFDYITPTARLHLPAGTATASTAPLKFTTGTALTNPEDGAVEYDTSHLWFTIGTTRYQLDQQSSVPTTTTVADVMAFAFGGF